MKEAKLFVSKILILCLVFLFGMSVGFCAVGRAETTETETSEAELMEDVKACRECVVHIESICWDGDTNVYHTKSFSGFVVSEDTSGIYVVTVCDDLAYTTEEKETIKTELGLEDNARISEKIEVVFNGDVRVAASIVGESEQRNLTVLKLDQTVNFEKTLLFAEKNASDKEQIFLLSYPGTKGGYRAVYNAENVVITSGSVINSYLTNEIIFFKHNIQTETDSVGGPLLDREGNIVGMFLASRGEKDGTAVSCEAIRAFLDTFNISYQQQEEIVEKKSFPVLNVILGAVIAALMLAVVLFQGKTSKEKETDSSGSKKAENGGKKAEKRIADAMEKVNARLEYPAEKRLVMIKKATFIIGRATEADFILSESKGISRRHAGIQFNGKDFYLTDLHSTNHTFLNGSEIMPGEKRILKDGDEIMAGKEKLIFRRMG